MHGAAGAQFLENDDANPCVGCGPRNPKGLQLRFQVTRDGVACRLAAEAAYQGWPGRLHSGILYTAMLETANWTVHGARKRVGLPVQTSALAAKRWVATGETLTLEGRVTRDDARAMTVRVVATDAQGAEVATLERAYDLPDRATFLKRMGYDSVPRELEDLLPP